MTLWLVLAGLTLAVIFYPVTLWVLSWVLVLLVHLWVAQRNWLKRLNWLIHGGGP